MRELAEETGLIGARIVRELPDFEATYRNFCENHAFHLAAEEGNPGGVAPRGSRRRR